MEDDVLFIFVFVIQIFCDTEENHCREWNNKRNEMGESSYDIKM